MNPQDTSAIAEKSLDTGPYCTDTPRNIDTKKKLLERLKCKKEGALTLGKELVRSASCIVVSLHIAFTFLLPHLIFVVEM